jgi:hypothetical protein
LGLRANLARFKVGQSVVNELKIACPSCGGHIAFPVNMHGQVISCPHCSLSVPLVIAGYVPSTRPEPVRHAQIEKRKRTSAGGIIIEIIGLLFCLTIVGAIIGIPLLFVGAGMASKSIYSACGNTLADKHVKMCLSCRVSFV